jgi:hypothetical protein
VVDAALEVGYEVTEEAAQPGTFRSYIFLLVHSTQYPESTVDAPERWDWGGIHHLC